MIQCLFLSTAVEKIQCFKECALFNWVEKAGECPFNSFAQSRPQKEEYAKDEFLEEDLYLHKSIQELFSDCKR